MSFVTVLTMPKFNLFLLSVMNNGGDSVETFQKKATLSLLVGYGNFVIPIPLREKNFSRVTSMCTNPAAVSWVIGLFKKL